MSTYNFDSTGLSPDNRIPGEKHTISSVSSGSHNYIVPECTPFFASGLTVIDLATGDPLYPGTDYILTHKYQDAIDNINLDVYGSVTLVDTSRTGTFVVSYQTLGGPFVTDASRQIQNGLNLLHDLTTTDYSELTNVPETFPTTPHNHGVTTGVEGVNAILDELVLMRQAMENPNTELEISDITDFDEGFVSPVLQGIRDIADAIISKSASTNIPFEMSTPGQTLTSLGGLNIGSWRDTSLACSPSVEGSYKIDFEVNAELTDPTKENITVEKRWTVNGVVIDRSYSNHAVIGLTKEDVVRVQVRLADGSASDVVLANTGHSSSLTITRLGN